MYSFIVFDNYFDIIIVLLILITPLDKHEINIIQHFVTWIARIYSNR